ncbi:MAG: YadA-like family protein [Thiolinea sp.]
MGQQAAVESGATHAVALGSGSVATAANISVGDAQAGLTRRITNVAPAREAYDAVNFGQYQQGLGGVREEAFELNCGGGRFQCGDCLRHLANCLECGGTHYRGEQAVSLSFSHRLPDSPFNTAVNGGVAYDSSQHALTRVGVSWEF